MPRKMSEEKEKEFEELSLFLEYYSTNCLGIDRSDEFHPSNCLEKIVEKFGKSKALQGLKQAIHDAIEGTSDFDFEDVKKLDSELSSKGIITLSVLRKHYWSKYKKVLKRGSIKNEIEYYLINGLVCDLSNSLKKEEKETLSSMLIEFEENA